MIKKKLISNWPLFIICIFLVPVFLYLAISIISIMGCGNSPISATEKPYNKTISSYDWSPQQRQELEKELAGVFDNKIFETIMVATEHNTAAKNDDKDVFLGDGYIRVKEWLPGESYRFVFFSHIQEIPEIEDEKIALAKYKAQFQ